MYLLLRILISQIIITNGPEGVAITFAFFCLFTLFFPSLNTTYCTQLWSGCKRRWLKMTSCKLNIQYAGSERHSAPARLSEDVFFVTQCTILYVRLWAIIQHSTVVWELTEASWAPQPLRDHLCIPAWQIRAAEYSCAIPPLITLD